jgi:hypothetical protein
MKKTLLTTPLFLVFSSLFAQTNFSGSYRIDTARIIFEQAPHWVLPVSFKLDQQGTKVTLTRNIVDAQGNASSNTEQLNAGDTVTAAITGNQLRKTIIVWSADRSSFTLTYFTTDTIGKRLNKATEKWSLLDEGKTLVLDRFVEQANGLHYSIIGYYTKQ